MLVRMWGEKNPYVLLVGIKISATSMESSMEFLKKLKIDLPYDQAVLLLGIYLKECAPGNNSATCIAMFTVSLLTNNS
jgi:hypothetical protein